jgi:hypothetical protein
VPTSLNLFHYYWTLLRNKKAAKGRAAPREAHPEKKPKDYGINARQPHKAILYSVSFWFFAPPPCKRAFFFIFFSFFFLLLKWFHFFSQLKSNKYRKVVPVRLFH